MNLEERLRYLEFANGDIRQQLDSCFDTLIKLQNKMDDVRLKLSEQVGRGQGLSQNELVILFWQIDRLFSGRKREIQSKSPEPIDPAL